MRLLFRIAAPIMVAAASSVWLFWGPMDGSPERFGLVLAAVAAYWILWDLLEELLDDQDGS